MKRYRIAAPEKIRLKKFDTDDTGSFADDEAGEAVCEAQCDQVIAKLEDLQGKLYASKKNSLLIVLQGMDTAGKDGVIKKAMGGFNPIGCMVHAFKVPTEWEMAHDYLWRVHHATPPKGYIGIFNRSHYEDVLVTRVHNMISKETARRRFEEIRNFEKHLADNGAVILKFFLHVSKEEQRKRLQDRVDTPKKRWKFNPGDLKDRALWEKYQNAYEDAIGATAAKHAPWYVIPADHKWYRDWVVARVLLKALEAMDLKYPPTPKEVDFLKIKVR